MKRSLSLLKPDKCKTGLSFITDSLLCFHWEPNLTAHQKATACCLYFHSFRAKIKINKDASMFLRKVWIEREELMSCLQISDWAPLDLPVKEPGDFDPYPSDSDLVRSMMSSLPTGDSNTCINFLPCNHTPHWYLDFYLPQHPKVFRINDVDNTTCPAAHLQAIWKMTLFQFQHVLK